MARTLPSHFQVTSTWLTHNEDGETEQQIASRDLRDIDAADALILFTVPPHVPMYRGGRHAESFYAYARGKAVVIVGPQENVFHSLLVQCSTLADAAKYLMERYGLDKYNVTGSV